MGVDMKNVGGGYYPKPTIDPITIGRRTPSTTFPVRITGHVLDRVKVIEVVPSLGGVTSVGEIEKDFDTLNFNVTINEIEQSYILRIVYQEGEIELTFEAKYSDWLDLRSGGNPLTIGSEEGNDIRLRENMTAIRDEQGMYFTGEASWRAWVKVETLQWKRGQNLTCEWIFTSPTTFMMVGIGSTEINESNNSQFSQAEVQTYFNSTTSHWGLYGNTGTVGSAGLQMFSVPIVPNKVYKVKFENDGTKGGVYSFFELPSAEEADWDDESNLKVTQEIGGTLAPDAEDIMPFIAPNQSTQRFIAVKVQ